MKKSIKIVGILGILLLISGILCVFFAPIRFGTVFFGGLGAGLIIEAYALHCRSRNKIWRIISVIGMACFLFFLVSFLLIQGIIQTGMHKDDKKADYIFVLGALVHENGQPSLALAKRLDCAYDYMIEYPESVAVLCGGKGDNEPIAEAESMRNYLVKKGIPENRLILESKSRNTIQNIANAKELLDNREQGDYSTIVISSDFHCARARRLMEHAGLSSAAIPAETPYFSQKVLSRCREYCSILGLMLSGRW